MGILSFFNRKSAEEAAPVEEAPPAEVELASLQDWFDTAFSDTLTGLRKRASEMCSGIRKEFTQISSSVSVLENAEFEKDNKMYAAVNMVKDTFVNRARSMVSEMSRGSGTDYSFLRSFHSDISRISGELLSLSPKQAMLLSRYFGKEVDSVAKGIKAVREQAGSMKRFLDSDGRMLWLAGELGSRIREQNSTLSEIAALERKISDGEAGLERLSEKLKRSESKAREITESGDFEKHRQASGRLEQVEDEISSLRDRVLTELNVSRRPLKKLKHASEKKSFSTLIQDPFNAWVSCYDIKGALKGMLEQEESGGLVLKSKEKEKITLLMVKLDTELERLRGAHRKLCEEKERLEADIRGSSVMKAKAAAEEELSARESAIKLAKEELENDGKQLSSLKSRLSEQNRKLEELVLENTGRRVRIKI
jgi:hypothetical protein